MNTMDPLQSFNCLSSQMTYEYEGVHQSLSAPEIETTPVPKKLTTFSPTIAEVALPGGKRFPVVKSLLTSACERDCYYCPFRAGRDFRRLTLKPDDMAKIFLSVERAGVAKGLFLSSGIAGGSIRTQDKLIETAEILRKKYRYQGYLHLKIMPGIEQDQLDACIRLASRISINLESPNSKQLSKLAPNKGFIEELLQPLRLIRSEFNQLEPGFRKPSVTTQFVVGAVGESDKELLVTTEYLYKSLGLARAYYSAFKPVLDTPFENLPAEVPLRQDRLYQASFLLRDYGYAIEELIFNPGGNLQLETDPKTVWANIHLSVKPVEINNASEKELLRIPGVGPIGAKRITRLRKYNKIHSIDDLKRLGINPRRSIPYILLDGKKPEQQLRFW